MKHTSGPWHIEHEYNIFSEHQRLVASAGGYTTNADNGEHVIENMANARLIAAAPELLEACRAAVERFEDIDADYDIWSYGTVNELKAAIAKVEGET